MAKAAPGLSEKEVFKMYSGGYVSADFVFRYLQSGGLPALAQAMRSRRRADLGAAISSSLMVVTISSFFILFLGGVVRRDDTASFSTLVLALAFVMLSLAYVFVSSMLERRKLLREIRAELAREIMET